MTLAGLILAGGRARRMGGVDKPGLHVGGRALVDAALAAVSGCDPVVVVGPHRPELAGDILQTREIPEYGGPVAAIAAGTALLPRDVESVVVLAADLPFIDSAAVGALVSELELSGAPAVFAAAGGRIQVLVGVWRAAYLRERLAAIGDPAHRPVRDLVPDGAATLAIAGAVDCDTPDEVRRAAAAAGLDVGDARDLIRISLPRLPVRATALRGDVGAVLAEPLVTAAPLPRFDTSAMDGYAIAGDGPWLLRAEVGYAGGALPAALGIGEAVRIATGAQVPPGTSAVLRDEFATVDGARLGRLPGSPVRSDIRAVGEDWQPGVELAPAGTMVTPIVESAAASAEATSVRVRGPVSAAVLISGDEIRRDGELRRGETRDSLGPALPDLLAWCGVRAIGDTALPDTRDGFDTELADSSADVIVVVGATGRGAADRLRPALARADARVIVERVRCRPGGSQVTAVLPDGRVVLGLPGNPFAAVATLLTTLPAIVDGLTGRTPDHRYGRLANADEVSAPLTRIVPVRQRRDGTWVGEASTRTAHLAGMLGFGALAIVPPNAVCDGIVELIALP